jgi:hypothetical protein
MQREGGLPDAALLGDDRDRQHVESPRGRGIVR